MYAAVRRGLIMEELARSSGDDEMRGEMFICGVFSLLDRMMRQPFAELLKNVPVQARVQSSLMTDDGPYTPHLELVRAIEQGSAVDIREGGERLLLAPAERADVIVDFSKCAGKTLILYNDAPAAFPASSTAVPAAHSRSISTTTSYSS